MFFRTMLIYALGLTTTTLFAAQKAAQQEGAPLPSPVPVLTGVSKPLVPLPAPKLTTSPSKLTNSVNSSFGTSSPAVEMKILVLAGDSSEMAYQAITTYLSEIGVPYNAVVLDTIPADANGNRLATFAFSNPTTGQGLYQGIILTDSTFGVCNTTCHSLLSTADWTDLANYESQFQVRVLSYFTWPDPEWGLVPADSGASYTNTNPLNVGFTAAAASIFPYLTRTSTIPVGSAGTGIWAYRATTTAAAGETTTPILTAGSYTVGATHTTADGRETFAITMDNGVPLLHSMAFNYGLINWMTKGVFLGSRQIYFNPQIDDMLIGDKLYAVKTLGSHFGWGASVTSQITISDPPAPAPAPPTSSSSNWPTEIASDMTGQNEGHPHGVPLSWDWANGPVIEMGNNANGWQALTGWGVVYEASEGNPAVNTRVNIRDVQTFFLQKSSGKWLLLQNTSTPSGEAYLEDFSGDTSKPGDVRNESDGTISVTAGNGYNFHFYPADRASINPNDIGGILTIFQARLIVGNPALLDDRSVAQYLAGSGADYYPALTGGWPGTLTYNPGAGIGKEKYVQTEWRFYSMTTLSAAQLTANPPPVDLTNIAP